MAAPLLRAEWDREIGFFGMLRDGQFNESGYHRVERLLETTDRGEGALNREFVAVTWYIPIFMTWQRERCLEGGVSAKAYDLAANRLSALVTELLGLP